MLGNEKSGFTLIELLAVIVILALIAVIASPIIIGVIDDAKKGTIKDSAYGYKDAVSKFYVLKQFEDSSYDFNGTYTVSELNGLGVVVSGREPTDGWVKVDHGIVTEYSLIFEQYEVSYDSESNEAIVKKVENKENDDNPDNNISGGLTDESTVNVTIPQDLEMDYYNSDIDYIVVNAEVTNLSSENVTLTYNYYQKSSQDEDYILKYSGPENTYSYLSLNNVLSYEFKVVVTDQANKSIFYTARIGALCFVAGTKVYTEKGYMNIENIKVGDYVYAIDLNTNDQVLKKVTKTHETVTFDLYHIKIGKEIISATPKHRFYVVNKGWINAYNLEVGDQLITKNGYEEITEIKYELFDKTIKTYNLEIADLENYLVTESNVLVHNGY